MLNGSTSPHKELDNLLRWLALPETQEVLNLLKDKSEAADRQIKSSPIAHRITLQTIEGPTQVPIDGVLYAALHNQFIGNFQGLTELSRVLANREADLRALIKQQEEKERQNVS